MPGRKSKSRKSKRSQGRVHYPRHVFKLQKSKVVVVSGSERFAEQRRQIQVRKRKALGKLGRRISKKLVPKHARLIFKRAPRGSVKRRIIVGVRVLITARIRGRIGHFTRVMRFKRAVTAKVAHRVANELLESLVTDYTGRAYSIEILSMKILFLVRTVKTKQKGARVKKAKRG